MCQAEDCTTLGSVTSICLVFTQFCDQKIRGKYRRNTQDYPRHLPYASTFPSIDVHSVTVIYIRAPDHMASGLTMICMGIQVITAIQSETIPSDLPQTIKPNHSM